MEKFDNKGYIQPQFNLWTFPLKIGYIFVLLCAVVSVLMLITKWFLVWFGSYLGL